jgi:hypothetical protein
MKANCQLHAPVALTAGNGLRYPPSRKLHGPQSQSGRLGKKKIFLRPGIEPRSFESPIFTSVYRLFLFLIWYDNDTDTGSRREAYLFYVWVNSDKVAINLLGKHVTKMCLHRTTVVSIRCVASTGRLKTNAIQNDSSFRLAIKTCNGPPLITSLIRIRVILSCSYFGLHKNLRLSCLVTLCTPCILVIGLRNKLSQTSNKTGNVRMT